MGFSDIYYQVQVKYNYGRGEKNRQQLREAMREKYPPKNFKKFKTYDEALADLDKIPSKHRDRFDISSTSDFFF